jgi:hypothetical protein
LSATINVTGSSAVSPGTLQLQLPQQAIATPVGTIQNIALSMGANTITIPTGTTMMVIQPPAGNTILVTLKGVAGDTGIPLHKTLATGPINLDSTAATFVLNAASAIANYTTITFW